LKKAAGLSVQFPSFSFGGVSVVSANSTRPDFDVHCPMMLLPACFDTQLDSIPDSVPFLSVDHQLIDLWAQHVPGHFDALNCLALVRFRQNDFVSARDLLESALAVRDDHPDVYAHLGKALVELGSLDDGRVMFLKALELDSSHVTALDHLAALCVRLRDVSVGISCYQKLLDCGQDKVRFHWNLACLLLMSGDFERGWLEFDSRWGVEQLVCQDLKLSFPFWSGESLEGQRIVIWNEQGVGDEVMFAQCVLDILARGALVTLLCDVRLVPLFQRAFSGVECVAVRSSYVRQLKEDAFDFQCPLGSLPRFLRSRVDYFPRHEGYLSASVDCVNAFRQRYCLDGEKVVGISWFSLQGDERHVSRSLSLIQLLPFFEISGIRFVSLQYGDVGGEVSDFNDKYGVSLFYDDSVDALKDMDRFAAQVASCDLVISVDNSTVHLAGALGKAVWALLPFDADWRWMMERDDCLWYPSARLFRQDVLGDWSVVLDSAVSALRLEVL